MGQVPTSQQNFLNCLALFHRFHFLESIKHNVFPNNSEHWSVADSWNPSLWWTGTRLSYVVNNMTADGLATPGATSEDYLFNLSSFNVCPSVLWCTCTYVPGVNIQDAKKLLVTWQQWRFTEIHDWVQRFLVVPKRPSTIFMKYVIPLNKTWTCNHVHCVYRWHSASCHQGPL